MNIEYDIRVQYADSDNNAYGLSSKRSLEKKYLNFSFGEALENTPDGDNDEAVDAACRVSGSETPALRCDYTLLPGRGFSFVKESISKVNASSVPLPQGFPLGSSGEATSDHVMASPVLASARVTGVYQRVEDKTADVVLLYSCESANVEADKVSVVFLKGSSGASIWIRDFLERFSWQEIRDLVMKFRAQMADGVFSRLKIYVNAKIMN